MTFDIRSATIADVAAITRLHVDSWRDTYTFIPKSVHDNRSYAYRYEEWLEILSNPDPDHLILTAWDGDILVGFSNCRRCDDPDLPEAKGEMHAIYFRKDYRGKAIGFLLFDHMIQFLVKRDMWPTCLWAFEENQIRHTYKAIGFSEAVHRNRVIAGVSIPEIGYLAPQSPDIFYSAINRRLREEGAVQQVTPLARPVLPPAAAAADQTGPETSEQSHPGQD